jgi:hypothetical protein
VTRVVVHHRLLVALVVVAAMVLGLGWVVSRGHHSALLATIPVAGPVPTKTPVPAATGSLDLSDPAIDSAPRAQRREFAAVADTSATYFRGMDQALRTGDVSLFNSVTDPRCKCREFASTMRGIYTDGRVTGGSISVTKMHVLDVSGRTSGVTVDYLMTAHTVSQHGRTAFYPGYLIHASLFVWREDDGSWKVGDLTRLAEDPL